MEVEPGDRASDCGGIMEPIAEWVRKNKEAFAFTDELLGEGVRYETDTSRS